MPKLYRQNIRHLCVDISSFHVKLVQSINLDVPHRHCRKLPKMPGLQNLSIAMGACMALCAKHSKDKVNSDEPHASGSSLSKEAIRQARAQLQAQSSPYLNRILENKQRGFKVDIYPWFADFFPRSDGARGVAVVSRLNSTTSETIPTANHHTSSLLTTIPTN